MIILIGAEYSSQSYRIDIDTNLNETLAYAYNHSEIKAAIDSEYRLSSWFRVNVNLGYQINFSSEFESRNVNSITFGADPTNAIFLNLGVFLSPPE